MTSMEGNPWGALDELGGAGSGGEAPAPHPREGGAPASAAEIAEALRTQRLAEKFEARRQKRQTGGRPEDARAPAPKPKEEPRAPEQPRAKAQPASDYEVSPEDAGREKRRKRTNWNLRENAVTKPDSEARGPVRSRPRVDDEPMRFEIDRSKSNRDIPSVISNEELQKAGWSADRFKAHEGNTDAALAARAERLREKILAELGAITKDAASDIAAAESQAPTPEQRERFARLVAESAAGNEPPESDGPQPERRPASTKLSLAERNTVETALRANSYDELMAAYGTMAATAGGDARAAEALMRERFAPADLPQLKRRIREGLEDVVVELPRGEFARGAATTERPAPSREQPERDMAQPAAVAAKTIGEAASDRPRRATRTVWPRADDSASRLAGFRLTKKGVPAGEVAAALPAERRRQTRRAASGNPRQQSATSAATTTGGSVARGGEPASAVGRDGNPIEVEVSGPGEVLSPADKRAMRQKFSSRAEAKKARPITVDENGSPVEATPIFETETHHVDMTEDEARQFRTHRPAEGTEDAESVRRHREKAGEALKQSRVGRRQVRSHIENPAFLRGVRWERNGRALSPGEVYTEGDRVVREQGAMERELEARLPAEGDDGSSVRAAVAAAAETAAASSGGNPYERLYETLRTQAPVVVGLGNEYTPDTIIEIVEALRRGEPGVSIGDLPETFGIRQAFAKIHDQERRARLLDELEKSTAIDVDTEVLPVSAVPGNNAATAAPQPRPSVAPRPAALAAGVGTPPPPTPPPAPAAAPAPAPAPAPIPVRAPAPTPAGPRPGWGRGVLGGVLLAGHVIGAPFSRAWSRMMREPSFPGKENPFKKERGPLYPFFWGLSFLWRSIGGFFGAKFEKPKEEKAK